jgi:hypothetical protein
MFAKPWTVGAVALGASLLVASAMLPITPVTGAETPSDSAVPVIAANGAPQDNTNPGDLGDKPAATTLDSREAKGVLGSAVRSVANEDMGRVIDVVVDRTGSPRAAVIDFGGFLGVGSRKVAIAWNSMRFSRPDAITLDLTRDQVRAAPQYEQGKPVIVLGAASEFGRSRVSERIPEH